MALRTRTVPDVAPVAMGEPPSDPGESPVPAPDADEIPDAPGEAPAPPPAPHTTPSEPGDTPVDAARERRPPPAVDR